MKQQDKAKRRYLGHDQYGNHYDLRGFPRKALIDHFGSSHVSKMYVDRPDGIYHVGYIILGHWVNIFGLEGVTFATKETG